MRRGAWVLTVSVAVIATVAVLALRNVQPSSLKVAVDLPLQGNQAVGARAMVNAVRLAIKDVGGIVGGRRIELPDSAVLDDSVNGVHNAQQGTLNMQTIVADPQIVAVIGPGNSSVAKAQIPISNEAGLFQCGPATTNPGLTKPSQTNGDPRPINFVRVVATDDAQGPAAARFVIGKLDRHSVYIIDDTETFGKGLADAFEAEFLRLGGTVVLHDGLPRTTVDYVSILTAAKARKPDVIYFAGVTSTGGVQVLAAAHQVGLGDLPFVGPDGINDGSGTDSGSFLNLTGDTAVHAYSTLAGIGDFPGKADFEARYAKEYGNGPTGYAGMAYACAQVTLDALGRALATNPRDLVALRGAVRAAAVDPTHVYDTILGQVTFDLNGDTRRPVVSIYSVDPLGADGKGEWVYREQVIYDH
jgi:branched-chain amino acid transport system substrate-binding protein